MGETVKQLYESNPEEMVIEIETERLRDFHDHPFKIKEDRQMKSLKESIEKYGILTPLIVRPVPEGCYEIISGHRRRFIAKMLGYRKVPVIIRELSDKEVDEIALIENLQREDLNPVEEAEGYRHLMSEYGMTQEQVAGRVGKSRPSVANAVRLLELPDSVLGMLTAGDLTVGHVRPLLGLHDEDAMVKIACMAVKRKMTVRDVEKQVKKEKGEGSTTKKQQGERDNYFDEVEIALGMALGRKVKVNGTANVGKLEIDFYSHEDLTMLANLLAKGDQSE